MESPSVSLLPIDVSMQSVNVSLVFHERHLAVEDPSTSGVRAEVGDLVDRSEALAVLHPLVPVERVAVVEGETAASVLAAMERRGTTLRASCPRLQVRSTNSLEESHQLYLFMTFTASNCKVQFTASHTHTHKYPILENMPTVTFIQLNLANRFQCRQIMKYSSGFINCEFISFLKLAKKLYKLLCARIK